MAQDDPAPRLVTELELLQAMYPEAISFLPTAREVKYVHILEPGTSALPMGTLTLRLPDHYPNDGLPEVLSASGPQREDLRSSTKDAMANLGLTSGEEVLDALILRFQELLSEHASRVKERDEDGTGNRLDGRGRENGDEQPRSVVIWLHHLLNTNKRKLALNPAIPGSQINGMTRPGYPGVLVFSGPKSSVDAHVSELRSQRWQAFQVRYDSEDDADVGNKSWSFEHGAGIREVTSMSELAQGISDPRHQEILLSAIGVR